MRLKNHRPKKAFTLLELLAVCALLAVIGGIAVPVVSNSMSSGKQAQCASNMRQIGAALLAYAAEHNGLFPPTSHTTGDSRVNLGGTVIKTLEYSWIYRVADYLGNVDEVRICPADESERRKSIRETHATSYILNDIVFDTDSGSRSYNRLQNIPSPSRTMLAFISNRPVSKTWDHAHCGEWTSWHAMLPDVAVDRHRVGARDPDKLKGSANYLYADGHIANIPAKEMRKRLDSGINPGTVPSL